MMLHDAYKTREHGATVHGASAWTERYGQSYRPRHRAKYGATVHGLNLYMNAKGSPYVSGAYKTQESTSGVRSKSVP